MPRPAIAPIARSIVIFISLGICFFGSLLTAAAFFPRTYDWRSTVISSLASPRDNPHAYGIACLGLALSGLLLIPCASMLRECLKPFAPKLTLWAERFFLLAALCLTLSALIVPGHYRLLGLGRTHEHLAQISSVAFCLALILYLGAVLRLPRSLLWLRLTSCLVVILPVTALIVSRLSLVLSYAFCSEPVYRAIRNSLWNSLALWEWIGAAGIYLFLGIMTLNASPPALPSHEQSE